jgi:hypothetical protein
MQFVSAVERPIHEMGLRRFVSAGPYPGILVLRHRRGYSRLSGGGV